MLGSCRIQAVEQGSPTERRWSSGSSRSCHCLSALKSTGQGAPQGRREQIKECKNALNFSLPQLGLRPRTLPVFVSQSFQGSSQGGAWPTFSVIVDQILLLFCLSQILLILLPTSDTSDTSAVLPFSASPLILTAVYAGLILTASCLKSQTMSFAFSILGFLQCCGH